MTQAEMVMFLIDEGYSKDNARQIVSFIYERGDLSRMGRTQTRDIIEESPFSIISWDDDIDDMYDAVAVNLVLAKNLYEIKEEDLKYKGARVILMK